MKTSAMYYHTRIDFTALKETKKAVLIKLKHVEDYRVLDLLNYYGKDVMEPIELWLPKSWLRLTGKDEIWVWRKGFMTNLEKLAEKRLAHRQKIKSKETKFLVNMDTIIPEGETIH